MGSNVPTRQKMDSRSMDCLAGENRPYHFLAVVFASLAVFLSPTNHKNSVTKTSISHSPKLRAEKQTGKTKSLASKPFKKRSKEKSSSGKNHRKQKKPGVPSVSQVLVIDQNREVKDGIPHENPTQIYAPPALVSKEGTLDDFLRAEIKVLDIMRYAHGALRQSIAELWAARGVRRRATAALELASKRAMTQKQKLDQKIQGMSSRYRALYKLMDGQSVIPLFDKKNRSIPRDGRVEMAHALAREMKELQTEKRVVDALLNTQKEKKKLLSTVKERVAVLDKKRDATQAVLALLKQHLRELRRRKEQRNRSHEVWNKKLRRLHRSVRDLAALVKEENRSFLSLKGELPRPVPGMILRRFGEERVKGTCVTIRHRGIDISAIKGWKVRSPSQGFVRYAGKVAGFQNVVILDHGEGFLSVLGHLKNLHVKQGQKIRTGSIVGEVFHDPACRKWDCTKVYYELRRGSVALNPSNWFRYGRKKKTSPPNPNPAPGGGQTGDTNLVGR